MKLLLTSQIALAVVAYQVKGANLRVNEHRKLTGDIEDKILFLSDAVGDYGEMACAQDVLNSAEVNVADCSKNPPGAIWTLKANGQLRNINGGCLQAGHGQVLQDGTWMRIKPCDNSQDLQKFVFEDSDTDGNPTGTLKLQSNNALCVTHRSNDVNMGNNFLIMKDCSVLPSRRKNWSLSYSVYDYLVNQDSAAISAEGINIDRQDIGLTDSVIDHPSVSWYMDNIGLIHNGYGECMQAGHGGQVLDGTHMRVYPCDENNRLQKFRIRDEVNDGPDVINGSGRFKLQTNDNLCITPSVRSSILIMKTCPNNNNQGGRWGWENS